MTVSRAGRAGILAVLLIAAGLRVGGLTKFSLGLDEIAEVRWSRLSWPEMIAALENDRVHPPLDYAIQYLFSRFGAGDYARRAPAFLAGIATVVIMISMVTRVAGLPAGIVAGLLLATSPTHVRFSHEVRPYAIGLFFLILCIDRLLCYARNHLRRDGLLWFFSGIAAAYSLYFAGIMAALVSAATLIVYREELRNLWRRLPWIVPAGLALYAPWIRVLVRLTGDRAISAPEDLNADWWLYRLQVLATGDWQREPVSLGSWIFWSMVAIGCLFALREKGGWTFVVWFVGGTASLIVLMQLHPHYPAVRHLLPAWLAAFPLVGFAAAGLWRWRSGRIAAAVMCAIILAFSVPTLRAYYDHGRPEWHKVAQRVANEIRPGERLFAATSVSTKCFGYYWERLGRHATLERFHAGGALELDGPFWIVFVPCPIMDPEMRARIEQLPPRIAMPLTNRCMIYYVPAGEHLSLPRPLYRDDC